MSFNYSQLEDENKQTYIQNYPQTNNYQPQQSQPLPYQPQQQQNIYPQQTIPTSTQNVQQQQQEFQQQSFSTQPVVNPITFQQTSWAQPSTTEPIIILLCKKNTKKKTNFISL